MRRFAFVLGPPWVFSICLGYLIIANFKDTADVQFLIVYLMGFATSISFLCDWVSLMKRLAKKKAH